MRKYRYGDPTKLSFFKKYGNFFYFFAAWNLLGLVAWKVMSASKSANDENWNKKSSTEKYLSLIGFGRDNAKIKHVKIHGLQVESDPDERSPTETKGQTETSESLNEDAV